MQSVVSHTYVIQDVLYSELLSWRHRLGMRENSVSPCKHCGISVGKISTYSRFILLILNIKYVYVDPLIKKSRWIKNIFNYNFKYVSINGYQNIVCFPENKTKQNKTWHTHTMGSKHWFLGWKYWNCRYFKTKQTLKILILWTQLIPHIYMYQKFQQKV